jgi:hypothetical protein
MMNPLQFLQGTWTLQTRFFLTMRLRQWDPVRLSIGQVARVRQRNTPGRYRLTLRRKLWSQRVLSNLSRHSIPPFWLLPI